MKTRRKKKQYAINVATGWLGQIVTMVAGIAQLPYVLWRLGPEAFGVFQLANSALLFFIFLQLGMQPTLVRFLSISVSEKDHTEISRVTNTALFILTVLGFIGAVSITLLSPLFISFYGVPETIRVQTFGLLYCLAGAFFVNFLAIVPASILMAIQRYDAINVTNIVTPLLRLGLIIASFELIGPSVVILGFIILTTQLLRLVYIQFMAAYQFGWKSILSFAYARWDTFKDIYKFSFLTFLNTVFSSLVQQGPVLMIGKLLSLEAAGFYAPAHVVANMIASFLYQTVSPLIPLASQARVEKALVKIGGWSIRICQIMVSMGLFIALPFCIVGKEITTLWLGSEQAFLWSVIAVAAVGSGIARGGSANGSLALGGGSIVPTTISTGVLALVLPLGIAIIYTLGFGELLVIVIFISIADIARSIFYVPFAYAKQFLYQPWDYIYRGFFKPILAFGVTLAIVWSSVWYLLPSRDEWSHLESLALVSAGCGVYVVLLWMTVMEYQNKELIWRFARKIIARVSTLFSKSISESSTNNN
jgi:O-antigen/teichoic acid export membrane protein